MSEPLPETNADDQRGEMFARFKKNPWVAHTTLFPHRHPDESSPAHRDLVRQIYAPVARVSIEGFRGMGKTTYAEEAILILAGMRAFRNIVIVGANYTRACERLEAIKNEIVVNDAIAMLFGQLKGGDAWQEGKIVLPSGVCIQVLGRDQDALGLKHLEKRPDAVLLDDVEPANEIRTDAERRRTWDWLVKVLLPLTDHPLTTWVRSLGTRRGIGSLPERMEKAGWRAVKYPIEHLDEAGRRAATWPGKFPLPVIDAMRQDYRGDLHVYAQEFMCQPDAEAARSFSREMFRIVPQPRGHHAVFAMYDPARTTHRDSATTGKAVWSWVGNKLVFWELSAHRWQPSEIIEDMFRTHAQHDLTILGFEETGLSEWAKQPIRAEQLRRRTFLPLKPVNAPKGKLDFIRSLQSYGRAGEIEFAGPAEDFEEAIGQFLSFPRGQIDAPNAAAYALLLRPGALVHENFTEDNINDDLMALPQCPLYLAANADGQIVTAALVQRYEGEVRILADWVREGPPYEVASDLHTEAQLATDAVTQGERVIYGEGDNQFKLPVVVMGTSPTPIRWVVPPRHSDAWNNVGLMQAVRAIPQGCGQGSPGPQGRVATANLMSSLRHGRPRFVVSPQARWTLRALSGGYCRRVARTGIAEAEPEPGVYALLMEGIESFVGVGQATEGRDEDQQPMAYNKHGMGYRSALPQFARR